MIFEHQLRFHEYTVLVWCTYNSYIEYIATGYDFRLNAKIFIQ